MVSLETQDWSPLSEVTNSPRNARKHKKARTSSQHIGAVVLIPNPCSTDSTPTLDINWASNEEAYVEDMQHKYGTAMNCSFDSSITLTPNPAGAPALQAPLSNIDWDEQEQAFEGEMRERFSDW